jgi:hypothetical protein
MKEQRKQVAPNEGFLAALSKYEDSLGATPIRPHISAGNGTAAEETTVSPSRDTSSVPHLTTNEGSNDKASEQPRPPHLDVMKVTLSTHCTQRKELEVSGMRHHVSQIMGSFHSISDF